MLTNMGVIIVIIILVLLMIWMLKMNNKYTHNMILMSRYKGQLHSGKKGQQIRAMQGKVLSSLKPSCSVASKGKSGLPLVQERT